MVRPNLTKLSKNSITMCMGLSTHPPTNKKPHECGTRLLNAGINLILACDIIPDTLVIN